MFIIQLSKKKSRLQAVWVRWKDLPHILGRAFDRKQC